MNILIIEDEKPAADKLAMLLASINKNINVIDVIQTVAESKSFLSAVKNDIDLIFMDIQLSDGSSFEIFKDVEVTIPIIFTTAYNEYALNAFKVNSIDYLLKPITKNALRASLKKVETLKSTLNTPHKINKTEVQEIVSLMLSNQKEFKKRFLVRVGDHLKAIDAERVCVFYADGRDVFLMTNESRNYIIDNNLEELNDMLDPSKFFRVNRTFIVNFGSVLEVIKYSNSRLKIITSPKTEKEVIVSRDKVADFKKWYGG